MTPENLKKKIEKSYIQYVVDSNKRPQSVRQFMEGLGEEEKSFYEHFANFSELEQYIWLDLAEATVTQVETQEVYAGYSVREKLLSFAYTLLEVGKEYRGFIQFCIRHHVPSPFEVTPSFMKRFKLRFLEYATNLVGEGLDTQEMVNRPFLSDRYKDLMWGSIWFILHFWLKDSSENFEKTDAAVEKSVNLAIDLTAPTPLDTAFDLAKFLFQNR